MLYVYVMLRCLYWLGNYSALFGENSVVYSSHQSIGNIKDFAFILLNNPSNSLSLGFIFVVILFCFSNLTLGYFQFLFDFLIWLCVLNLHNKIYSSLTGGDYLLNQFLFFNVFLLVQPKFIFSQKSFIYVLLSNTATLALIIQICLVYFISAIAKLIDAEWLNGTAILQLTHNLQFNVLKLHFESSVSKIISTIINYLVLFYQFFFPILVFSRKLKKPVLLVGIAIHLGIIIFMGLFWFGLIMILSYVLFWPSKSISV